VLVCVPHGRGPELMGDLPGEVKCVVSERPDLDAPGVTFWVPPFLRPAPTAETLTALRDLQVVQLLTAGADAWIGRLPGPVTLCDGRGIHTKATSEWALTAILSYLRDFPLFARAQARQEWAYKVTDELADKRVLIVGSGAIGEGIAARLAPFEVTIDRVARTARDGVHGLAELPDLLPKADVVVVIVPLTSQTRGMVDAAFLAALRDGALFVNAARGPVVDTEALTAELATGRIGAALDVTDPEPLPPRHPLWAMPNVLLTPHVGGSVRGTLRRAYALAGEQIRRYAAGEALINIVTGEY